MHKKRTLTSREQIVVLGEVKERTATHIVTGAHGWETLCTSGCNIKRDETGVIVMNAVEIARDQYPVTCGVCAGVWKDVHGFTQADICLVAQFAPFFTTSLPEIRLEDGQNDNDLACQEYP
ncbi:hypothetical protein [Erwinia amylovora]|uniref:hypothetical protein n=1 Tax=Erwinia amylovora TaxID=552 RepID=UPI0020BFA716|nr:hypothetical protein [Erwinia amylovora]MCK8417626.1 hypothetical protein [Erwinia amylovora]